MGRYFFALWPDDATRAACYAQTQPLRALNIGRQVQVDNYHITLAFLGSLTANEYDEACRAGSTVRAPSFELALDHYGYWPKPQVAWIGVSEIPKALIVLHKHLVKALKKRDFKLEKRAYHPHLTVLRKVRRKPVFPEIEAVAWPAASFALVESVSVSGGVVYTPKVFWSLLASD